MGNGCPRRPARSIAGRRPLGIASDLSGRRSSAASFAIRESRSFATRRRLMGNSCPRRPARSIAGRRPLGASGGLSGRGPRAAPFAVGESGSLRFGLSRGSDSQYTARSQDENGQFRGHEPIVRSSWF